MLHAGLRVVVDDAPRLTASAADRVLAEEDSERRRRAVDVLKRALRNRRNKDKKKAAKRRAASAVPDAAPTADACADRVAHADPRAAIRAAMRAHATLTSVRLELESADTYRLERIDSGDGSAASIRRMLQECLDRIGSAVQARGASGTHEAREASATHNALVMAESRSLGYTFMLRLVGVGVGTIRMLRRSDVDKLDSTAAVLLQTLVEERACWQDVDVRTGADEADTLPSDVAD